MQIIFGEQRLRLPWREKSGAHSLHVSLLVTNHLQLDLVAKMTTDKRFT